ncbi:MAG: glycerol-3-phosphate dehydrogenase [Alphaproteobacteria bacterium]|nr:glycerol-3-phosphate dehydrogenase [Alphaproteobacteria bacterium]
MLRGFFAGQSLYDLLVIGGGINGAGIVRDAQGRGLRTLLVEASDLASATSSSSSKLIHGGLRYLEQYEFRLVREALIEREVLLRMAPHLVKPLSFVLPHRPHLRPAWMIRLGLFLYDHLGGREKLPGSYAIDTKTHPFGAPLSSTISRAFVYADCWVDDARLVVANARDAADRGAEVRTRTRCTEAKRESGAWRVRLADEAGATNEVTARAVVNAAGPWVNEVLGSVVRTNSPKHVRLIKGSHIVVPKLHDGPQAYILQNEDRRIVFVLPYEDRFSLIGTTDEPFDGDPAKVAISSAETAYLCDVVTRHFRTRVSPEDVIWSYAGVRPLHDDAEAVASQVTRDYAFDLDLDASGGAPLLSIFGGKITTFRKLAEHALDKLLPHLRRGERAWTKDAALPGGAIANADFDAFLAELTRRHPWLPEPHRLARAYGSEVERLIGDAKTATDLGHDFGHGFTERELEYLVTREWARMPEDVLWRRSKLGLHLDAKAKVAIADWFSRRG